MKRETIEKLVVTLVLLACYIWMLQIGYRVGDDDYSHLLYMFSHANIWHLAGNVFVLWMMRGRLHLIPSIVIAFLFSYAPVVGSVWSGFMAEGVTMGFSGALFAMAGIKWGRYIWLLNDDALKRRFTKSFFLKVVPIAVAGVLIPHVNWCIHTYCLMAGFIYGRCRR